MFQYKRIEAEIGSYTPEQFMELLNNYAKEYWELVYYCEHEGLNYRYKFVAVMKLQIAN